MKNTSKTFTVIIKAKIQCGETTCAYAYGKFCGQLGTKNFGKTPVCVLFDKTLRDDTGWVERCNECLEAEQKALANSGVVEKD